jgi:hypothetical protein
LLTVVNESITYIEFSGGEAPSSAHVASTPEKYPSAPLIALHCATPALQQVIEMRVFGTYFRAAHRVYDMSALGELQQQILGIHRLAHLRNDSSDHAITFTAHGGFHFHGLDGRQHIAPGHL